MDKYSKEILRIWISLVYLLFGFSQLFDPVSLVWWLPEWISVFPVDANIFIYANWGFEVILWLLLIFWFQTRIVALLMSIHMLIMVIHVWNQVWYNGTFVRDFWILVANVVIFLNGKDSLCLDTKLSKKEAN
jgi:uncharacterized membrane protein YphA (DoxX/SURF4 family)